MSRLEEISTEVHYLELKGWHNEYSRSVKTNLSKSDYCCNKFERHISIVFESNVVNLNLVNAWKNPLRGRSYGGGLALSLIHI